VNNLAQLATLITQVRAQDDDDSKFEGLIGEVTVVNVTIDQDAYESNPANKPRIDFTPQGTVPQLREFATTAKFTPNYAPRFSHCRKSWHVLYFDVQAYHRRQRRAIDGVPMACSSHNQRHKSVWRFPDCTYPGAYRRPLRQRVSNQSFQI
jgi:hypothetical protein